MIDWEHFSNKDPLHFILGPCQIESERHATDMALLIREITRSLDVPDNSYIFKASYDKANRTSKDSPRGVGVGKGLRVLSDIKYYLDINVTTDVHDTKQAIEAGRACVDIIQIPALLSRQTDLIASAGKVTAHERVVMDEDAPENVKLRFTPGVSIKKGQFATPWSMQYTMEKVGHDRTVLIERGTSFGYENLVVDMRGVDGMKKFGRVVMDASHAAQKPGGGTGFSTGDRQAIPVLAKAATALGIAGVFMEVHDRPERALSDGSTSVKLDELKYVLEEIITIDRAVKGY
jgi:2-dehydro-3-deoxyphosphooctonate aldolase (KDO 8-P synthase)